MGRHDHLDAYVRPQAPAADRTAEADTVVIGGRKRARNLSIALLVTLGAAALPGSGHLALRRRTGWPIMAAFLLLLAAAGAVVTKVPRARLIELLLSPDMLTVVIIGCFAGAVLWLAVVLRTYDLAKPRGLGIGKQLLGGFIVLLTCLAVGAPFAFAGYTANAQRSLLSALFPSEGRHGAMAPAGDADAINKPRINILLLGSDAGVGRIGTRTDTMVVASIDTKTGRTILFSLPRNTSFAQFPPGSKAAKMFPKGFHDPRDSASGNYLLNAVYAYGEGNPSVAPSTPSNDPGLNLLMSSISEMLGLALDYYIKVNMAGFASIIDALGGLDVNVGPKPIPIGGIGPFGEVVKPSGYIPAGRQHLNGEQALWFARSRTNSTDYVRMGRQRCMLQYLVNQKTPVDVLKNFQKVAAATRDNVSTNIPQEVLPTLVTLAGKAKTHPLESIAFDPNLRDPEQRDGHFDTGNPNFPLMRQVVRAATGSEQAATSPAPTTPSAPTAAAPTSKTVPPSHTTTAPRSRPSSAPRSTTTSAPAPVSLDEACSEPPPN